MSVSDLIAAYGALLATGLGVIQFLQWRKSKQFLAAQILQIHYGDHVEIELSLSNRGQFPVTLIFVAFGITGSDWRTFWRRDPLSIVSMSGIEQWTEDGTVKGERIDGHVLQPGETIKAVTTKEVFERIQTAYSVDIFYRLKPSVWIEHSQSDHPICKVIRWED